METLCSEEALSELLQTNPAVLILFGGPHCGVCQAIKPQLEKVTREKFPKLATAYIDCQESGCKLCAVRGIFSLPVVQLWPITPNRR